jgi:hypothetical protein
MAKKLIFNPNQKDSGKSQLIISGIVQPPKKKIELKALINNIFEYSPKENKAKLIAEYSTLYPDTNSASASGKSNG